MMAASQVYETVVELIGKVSTTKDVAINPDDWDKPLTGSDIGLDAIDLAYLFIELSEHYSIRFESKDIENYNFNSVNSIARTIQKKLPHGVVAKVPSLSVQEKGNHHEDFEEERPHG